MRNVFLMIYRLSLTIWLGAALFFSAVAIKPIRAPEIAAEVRPKLAMLLFPGYYRWGLGLLATALVSGLLALPSRRWSQGRARLSLICATLSLACLLADLRWVYVHLEGMMAVADSTQVMPAEFRAYHVASMTINAAMGSLCLLAALLACWPGDPESRESEFAAQVDAGVNLGGLTRVEGEPR